MGIDIVITTILLTNANGYIGYNSYRMNIKKYDGATLTSDVTYICSIDELSFVCDSVNPSIAQIMMGSNCINLNDAGVNSYLVDSTPFTTTYSVMMQIIDSIFG